MADQFKRRGGNKGRRAKHGRSTFSLRDVSFFSSLFVCELKVTFFQQTVCAAFEQQLQKFRISSPESKNTNEKDDTITETNAESVETSACKESKKEAAVNSPTMTEKVVPAESMTSISSHASNSSSNSFEELRKRNDRKNWVSFNSTVENQKMHAQGEMRASL